MRKNAKLLLAVVALTVTCGLFTGCQTGSTIDRALFRPTQYVTNQVPEQTVQVRTQQVVVVTMTNQLGEVIGYQTNRENVVVPVVIPAHPVVKPVAWEPNPTATSTAQMVGGLFGPYGALGATALTSILGAIAAFRGKKYKDAAISLAQGIQHGAEQFPEHAPALISIQKQVQDADGTRAVVDKLLHEFVIARPVVDPAPTPAKV